VKNCTTPTATIRNTVVKNRTTPTATIRTRDYVLLN